MLDDKVYAHVNTFALIEDKCLQIITKVYEGTYIYIYLSCLFDYSCE